MSGNSLLLDTNTVLYFLEGDQTLADFFKGRKLYISVITELELLSFNNFTQSELKVLTSFIDQLHVENINDQIKSIAIQIRRTSKLKLPDCIIAATSIALNVPIISADKGLKLVHGLDLIIFER